MNPESHPPAGPPPLTRWKVVLAYHGREFVGWQLQPTGRSVQGELERALEIVLGHPARVSGSGRTDAGVHAEGQVASFTTTVERSVKAVRDGLNANLPPDLAVLSAEIVPLAFDPRRSSRRKRYRYTWLDRWVRSPHLADRSWHVLQPLDVEAMHRSVQALVGTHDVAAFRAEGCGATTTVRTTLEASVSRQGDLVHLDIVGRGFLRHMVRIVAGTLFLVGHHRRDEDVIALALASLDRRQAGPTAPAHGLCLMEVSYDGPGVHEDDDQ